MTVQAEQLGGSAGVRRPRSPGIVLATLTFVYVLNFLDRQLLAILSTLR